ncbi:hypothetical protein ATANTOWER_025779, partial [Ataeniobius toweri]|nr:hypothetical protein [Ataeniobius toweri]
GIAQPKQRPCDEPESIRVCQWAVERLRAAQNPENLPQPEEDLSKALILRHYGDGKVCQSRSGLPCGGFYTNVFSDGQRPVTLVTITPFGYGAVTHPLSSTITAVWDHDGGFMLDNFGNTTKEWSWQTYHRLRSNVIIQVSEEISVKLFSGMSGVLSFRCQNESVHLTLCFVTNKSQLKKMPCLQKENKFTLGAAQELHLLKKPKCPATVPKSAQNPRKTLMVKEEEQQVEPSALWRRRQNAVRDLQRLQQRVRNAVEAWLDCYRVAIGIKCPDTERLLGGQLGTQPRRAAQSAALPSLNSPERKEAALLHAGRSRKDKLRESHRCLSASPEKPQDRLVQIQRILKKQGRNELPVTQIGPLRIHGNIKPESVILSHGPESETPPTSYGPGDMVPLLPSIPLTTCPALLRAALQAGEEQRRRCCCSATLMPVVTDLEYDAFIMGQPLDSKQILVVCVTPPQPSVNTHTATRWDVLEDLFRTRNKNRAMPCTQCQMDSFRLVRYEMSAGMAGFGPENVLLQQRHGAAPGMFLMYLKGKLLFVGYIFTSDSCLVEDLQRQICRTRRDHRLGLSLPTDHKFSDAVKTPAATEA